MDIYRVTISGKAKIGTLDGEFSRDEIYGLLNFFFIKSGTLRCGSRLDCLGQGRQPLARVPFVARERIFHGTPSYFTHMPNLHNKRARRTRKLKLSTMHEINSLKISQGCNSQYNIYCMSSTSVLALPFTLTTGPL